MERLEISPNQTFSLLVSLTKKILEALEAEGCQKCCNEDVLEESSVLQLAGACNTCVCHQKIIQIANIHL